MSKAEPLLIKILEYDRRFPKLKIGKTFYAKPYWLDPDKLTVYGFPACKTPICNVYRNQVEIQPNH